MERLNQKKRFTLSKSMLFVMAMLVFALAVAQCLTMTVAEASDYVASPTIEYDNITYNTAVVYKWKAGSGADKIAVSANYQYFSIIDSSTFTEICLPYYVGDNICYIQNINAKSYNSATNTYSAMATIEYTQYVIDGVVKSVYGYPCKYKPKGILSRAIGGYIPTSYDKNHYLWSHGADTGAMIKGTVTYKDKCADIQVKIPWIGYNSSSVTIEGITFDLRTGPNKCSLRCRQSGIYNGEVGFAFGID